MLWTSLLASGAVALAASPAPPADLESAQRARIEALARSVTIQRDTFGVPHVYGPTDASVVFGFTYARCEDRFATLERFYLRALGRLAEVYGEAGLGSDVLMRAVEIERLSRAEYERADPELRALCDAFAAAVNHFLAQHPEVEPELLTHWEPWFPLAGQRAMWSLYGFEWNGITTQDVLAAVEWVQEDASDDEEAREDRDSRQACAAPLSLTGRWDLGCNEWALAPSRTASGHALLLIDLHLPLEAPYEGHLISEEGYRLSGCVAYGHCILPILGFNDRLGWAFTNNYIDWVDLYRERFDDPDDPLRYRYGDEWRSAETWTDQIRVKTAEGVATRRVRFKRTHHGPILAERAGQPVAVKIAGIEEGGVLQQLYDMGRAQDLDAFRTALDRNALVNQNLLYADADGHILYVYNGLVPCRPTGPDWSEPVDGSDPANEWSGVHRLGDRPQVLDPESGFLQNCNSSPFGATDGLGMERDSFPTYMIGQGDRDNERAREARRLLGSLRDVTFEQWAAIPFHTYVPAERSLDALCAEFDRAEPGEVEQLAQPVQVLRDWDRHTGIRSVATTLYQLWTEKRYAAGGGSALDKLRSVVSELERQHGSWSIAWGDVNRHQRPEGEGSFSDERMSLPIAGTLTGGAWVYISRPLGSGPRRYGVHGHAYVCAVEFGSTPRARSIIPYGQSSDPRSPHYFDQGPYYASGQLKPCWRAKKDLDRHTSRLYHPGEESTSTVPEAAGDRPSGGG